jgi:hypothetical protein
MADRSKRCPLIASEVARLKGTAVLDAKVVCADVEVVWAPLDGAQAALVCVFEN